MGRIKVPALECYYDQAINKAPGVNIVKMFIILFKNFYSLSVK